MNAPAVKTKDTLEQFRDGIIQRRDVISKELSAYGISFETFMATCIAAARNDMEVFRSRTDTIWTSLMRAARDGLLPDGKEGVIVHFNDKKQGDHIAQWMPMAQGLIKRIHTASTSGVKTFISRVVHDGDEFEYFIDDDGEHIKHWPFIGESGKRKAVYAVVSYLDGSRFVEVMSADEIAEVRKAAKQTYIWDSWADEMWKKSAIRRLSKRLPLQRDKISFEGHDEEFDLGQTVTQPQQLNDAQDGGMTPAKELPPPPMTDIDRIPSEVLKHFPDAKIVEVRTPVPAPPKGPPKRREAVKSVPVDEGGNYDLMVESWKSQLKAMTPDEQAGLFEQEIDPAQERGDILPLDYQILKSLVRDA